MAFTVLVIDDESDITSLISDVLEDFGYGALTADNGRKTLETISVAKPDAVLLDIWLGDPEFDGIDLLKNILKIYPNMPVIMMSGHGNIETAVKSMKLGAFDFIEKPFKIDHLKLLLNKVENHVRNQNEILDLRSRATDTTEVIAQSPAMMLLIADIKKIAPTNSRILIQGPSGAGKEDTARYLHSLSLRKDDAFLAIHGSEFNASNFDKIMYGSGKEPGILNKTARGTLCLHEISDLNMDMQIKLLNLLNKGSYEKKGIDIKFDITSRIICTTQRDIKSLVAEGLFKEDLYYRLSSHILKLPPLSERNEDIVPLTNHLMTTISKRNGKIPCSLNKEVTDKLSKASWPGNIRQLRNVIEWLVIIHGSTYKKIVIGASMLPGDLIHAPMEERTFDDDIVNMPLKTARYEFERLYLKSQIERFSGNISRTANFIGMERSALHRKLKTMSINMKNDQPIAMNEM